MGGSRKFTCKGRIFKLGHNGIISCCSCCLCVCVCACVCVCTRACACACVCARQRENSFFYFEGIKWIRAKQQTPYYVKSRRKNE
jgi:hypothetical protein